ncbi:rhodanese-like domain-containing protein [Ditylenchus destructor]|nr:rhodanese-like domain-containing protein [Ditylenchus destructor]
MSDNVTNAKISAQSTASLFEKNLVVDKILDKRQNGDKIEYLVKCKNVVDPKWISDTVLNCRDLISDYECAQNEVVKISGKRVKNNTTEYKVKIKNSKKPIWMPATDLHTYGDLILKFEMAHENNASRHKTVEAPALVDLTSFPVKCSVSNESFNASAIKKAKPDDGKMNVVFINKKVATNIETKIGQITKSIEFNEKDVADKIFAGAMTTRLSQLSSVSFNTSFPLPVPLPLTPDSPAPYSLIAAEKAQIRNDKAFRSISCDTLCELFTSLGEKPFQQKYILVDCRYPYEFNGGHIKFAINLYDASELPEVFYPQQPAKLQKMKFKTPIFYCEFSQKRGPTMARRLRRLDRDRNHEKYPGLDYTEIYVLDRGYRMFHQDGFLDFCEPKGYIPMIHPNHVNDLKKYKRQLSLKRLL